MYVVMQFYWLLVHFVQCLSGKVKSGGVIDDILFGGVDTGGDKEPSIKEMQDFNEEFGKLLW